MKVLGIILDGFEELEAMAPFSLLRRAGIDVTIASYAFQVKGSHGFTISNIGCNLDDDVRTEDYDALIIPGGKQYKLLVEDKRVHEIIKGFMDSNKLVATICAAPTILGRLGYLKGKNYTCFTAMNEDFGGTYHKEGVVTDGNLITGRSVNYAIDFSYEIIRYLAGDEALLELKKKVYAIE